MHTIIFPTSRARRMREAIKHPDQAAMVARLPIVGRRVPMRPYWQRQSPDPYRMVNRGVVNARPYARAALERGRVAAGALADLGVTGVVERARDARRAFWHGRAPREAREATGEAPAVEVSRDDPAPAAGALRRRPAAWLALPVALGAAALGAVMMYYADPQAGRRRRALVRDRLSHYKNVVTRKAPRTAERRGRFFRGRARGLQHDVLHRASDMETDNETLVARVRSEVLRDHSVKAGEIHVDAYDGTVTLRGQLDSADDIRAICRATQRVDGVREVRSYLHLPGTPPPNKAEAYAASEGVPAHMARV